VFYESLQRSQDNISLEGVAESYPRITELMRRLGDSEWFQNVDLDNIAAIESTGGALTDSFRFTLIMALELPTSEDEV
ncbi:MAG: PilN domain-containing protein, partial [Gimesia chilikensis]